MNVYFFILGVLKMSKIPFITKEKAEEIIQKYPTPFHIYDEKAIRENARKLKQAFSWNKGFKEFFCGQSYPQSHYTQNSQRRRLRYRLLLLFRIAYE